MKELIRVHFTVRVNFKAVCAAVNIALSVQGGQLLPFSQWEEAVLDSKQKENLISWQSSVSPMPPSSLVHGMDPDYPKWHGGIKVRVRAKTAVAKAVCTDV